jgi:hypothetical protein
MSGTASDSQAAPDEHRILRLRAMQRTGGLEKGTGFTRAVNCRVSIWA